MIDHAIKKVLSIFNRSSIFKEIELEASITSDCIHLKETA